MKLLRILATLIILSAPAWAQSLDMFPCDSVHDFPNGNVLYVEVGSHMALRVPQTHPSSDFSNPIAVQNGSVMSLTSRQFRQYECPVFFSCNAEPSGLTLRCVLLVRPQAQVIWVDTRGVVTGMHNNETNRVSSGSNQISETMGITASASDGEPAVGSLISVSRPYPTAFSDLILAPKPFNYFGSKRRQR